MGFAMLPSRSRVAARQVVTRVCRCSELSCLAAQHAIIPLTDWLEPQEHPHDFAGASCHATFQLERTHQA